LASSGAFFVFFPVYLVERGLSLAQVGVVSTVPVAVQPVSGILWRGLADLWGRTNLFLVQALTVWMVSVFVLPTLSSFTEFLALGAGRALLPPIMERLIVTSLFKGARAEARGATYSKFAVWGSVDWAVGVALAGVLVREFGTTAAFYLSGALLCAATLVILSIHESDEPSPEPGGRRGLSLTLDLFRNRRVLWLLLSSLPLILALNASSQFFPVRLKEVGTSSVLIGLV